MFNSSVEQGTIARLAQAECRLMRELAASHGLAFAAAFRIEHANEVARAMWSVATTQAARGESFAELNSIGHRQLAVNRWRRLLNKWRQTCLLAARYR